MPERPKRTDLMATIKSLVLLPILILIGINSGKAAAATKGVRFKQHCGIYEVNKTR